MFDPSTDYQMLPSLLNAVVKQRYTGKVKCTLLIFLSVSWVLLLEILIDDATRFFTPLPYVAILPYLVLILNNR